jgi:hypothetical protein
MPEPRPVPDLTPDQMRVMDDMFISGMTVRQACKKHDISPNTLWHWQQEPGWKAEWEARQAEQNEQFYRLLGTATGMAAKTYLDCMKDPKAKWVDKLHAADSVSRFSGFEPAKKVEHGGKIETTDEAAIAARIAALEAELLVREEI